MRLPSYAVKGAVLLSLLTTPVYANQGLIKATRSLTIQEIAKFLLEEGRHMVVKSCRVAKINNMDGFSYFRYSQTEDNIIELSKETGIPYDVARKLASAMDYAMHSVCPDVY